MALTLNITEQSNPLNVSEAVTTIRLTIEQGVGPAGPNNITTSTGTNITGILKGDGSTVSAAVAGTDYAAVSHTHVSADVTDATSDGANNRGKLLKTDNDSTLEVGILRVGKNAAGYGPRVFFEDGGNDGYSVDLYAPTLSDNKSVALPTASGNLALTAQTDGTIRATDLDYANTTDIGADLADADEVLVSDGGGNTTRRKSALSRFWTYIKAKADPIYVALTGNQTVAGNKTLSGQLELTGQAATNSTSAMTRGLVDSDRWRLSGLLWNSLVAPSFSSSGAGSGALQVAGDRFASLVSGTANSGYAKARITRGLNSPPGITGSGIMFGRAIGFSSNAVIYTGSGTTDTSIRFIVGTGTGAPTAADSDPISDKGFGVEFRYDGTNTEWRVFGYNSSLTASAWTDLVAGTITAPGSVAVYSDGAGNITAYYATNGGRTLSTISTTGGPTATGSNSNSYVSVEAVNSSTGTSSAICYVYDCRFYTP